MTSQNSVRKLEKELRKNDSIIMAKDRVAIPSAGFVKPRHQSTTNESNFQHLPVTYITESTLQIAPKQSNGSSTMTRNAAAMDSSECGTGNNEDAYRDYLDQLEIDFEIEDPQHQDQHNQQLFQSPMNTNQGQ